MVYLYRVVVKICKLQAYNPHGWWCSQCWEKQARHERVHAYNSIVWRLKNIKIKPWCLETRGANLGGRRRETQGGSGHRSQDESYFWWKRWNRKGCWSADSDLSLDLSGGYANTYFTMVSFAGMFHELFLYVCCLMIFRTLHIITLL